MNLKKRLIFLYRYFRTSRRWRKWINTQSMMVVGVSAIFLVMLSWTAPYSASQQEQRMAVRVQLTSTAAALASSANQPNEPTHTPYPPEYYSNSSQTLGVTLAGAVLVLIVVIGVLLYLPKKTEN